MWNHWIKQGLVPHSLICFWDFSFARSFFGGWSCIVCTSVKTRWSAFCSSTVYLSDTEIQSGGERKKDFHWHLQQRRIWRLPSDTLRFMLFPQIWMTSECKHIFKSNRKMSTRFSFWRTTEREGKKVGQKPMEESSTDFRGCGSSSVWLPITCEDDPLTTEPPLSDFSD